MGGSISYSGALRNCALMCSIKRSKGKCREQFGSMACNNCKWCLTNYADVDSTQAKLFIMQTDFEAQDAKKAGRTYHITMWFIILLFLGLGIRSYNATYPLWYRPYTSSILLAKDNFKVKSSHSLAETYTAIEDTLVIVAARFALKYDEDRDGFVDCHDSTISFYNFYPYKDEVRILSNVNKDTNMCHAFVAVLIGNEWKTIEPFAWYGFPKGTPYFMKDYWGKKYNPKYDVEETNNARQLGWIK